MRYFAVPERERREAQQLPAAFRKIYQPAGDVTLVATSVVGTHGLSLVALHGAELAIHPDAGAWAFVDEREAALLREADGAQVGALAARYPGAEALLAACFRRGLVSIDGHRAVDAAMFDDSPNYQEGHLVELLLTEKCNLGCHYCLAGTSPDMPAMTPEIARRTVDLAFAMAEAPVFGFEFSGGEPFMKFALMRDLVRYIQNHPERRGRRIYLSVQSNGTLLTAERVAWLRDNDVQIGLSLDGQPWSQNTSRPMVNGRASFPRLLEGIDLLQRAGIKFGALVVLNRSNVGSVEDLVDFLLDNDLRSFKLNPVSYLGAARANWETTGLTAREVVDYFVALVAMIAQRRLPLIEANLHTMLEFLTSKQRRTRCMRSHCGAGDTFQAVSAAGDIYPCGRTTQTPAMKLGNVLDPACASLSAAGRHHPELTQLRGRRPRDLEGCTTCPYRQFCQAGCSAQAYERYGTVRHRTPDCEFFKTLYPHLMYELCFRPGTFDAFDRAGYFDGGRGALIDEPHLHGGAAALRAHG